MALSSSECQQSQMLDFSLGNEQKLISIEYKRIWELQYQKLLISKPLSAGTLKTTIAKKLGTTPSLLNIVVHDTRMLKDADYVTNYSSVEILVNKETRRPVRPMYETNKTCVIDQNLFDNPDRKVKMPCGHAITPDNLYSYCLSELKKSKTEIKCPDHTCNEPWDFHRIMKRADLSTDERIFLDRKMQQNLILHDQNVRQCPRCVRYLERINTENLRVECPYCKKNKENPFEFCWKCNNYWVGNHLCRTSREEIQNILENCERITLGYSNIANVPRKRLCPECRVILEIIDGCKTMTCTCGYVFCFSCLKSKDGKALGCNKYGDKCEVAPVQNA